MEGIYFNRVTKRFNDKTIFEDSTFRVESGITLLISPNGTGKSTIIYSIIGNYRINSGRIYVNGYDPVTDHKNAFLGTSLMPENPAYFGSGSVKEHIDLFSRLKGINKREIYDYLSFFGVNNIIKSTINSLSMGELQILHISCYLSGNFKLYIFDEPNSNLDQMNRRKFSEAVKGKKVNFGSIFLITSHVNDELGQYANNILTISHRKIRTFEENQIYNAYSLKFYDLEGMEEKLGKLKHFKVNDAIIITNTSINNITNMLPEENIREIIRIPPAMVDYYEAQK
ncbi:MAG: ABC transporter ATP-binding protein [Candidatus Thermoplasmatota archaeon]|jgi:ABC-2 type transport system ATP-binding protein|nr:ABC transporter ATP-binding protein [Candidatus Thermoplasmatota archaeon]